MTVTHAVRTVNMAIKGGRYRCCRNLPQITVLHYIKTTTPRLRAYGASYGKFLEDESILFAKENQIVPQNLYLFVFDFRSLVTFAHFARN